jgi:hypothetical protein
MSKFIVVHTKSGGAMRVNIDHITTYDAQLYRKGSYVALPDFPETIEAAETPEEIDKLIEEAESENDAGVLVQRLLDQVIPALTIKPRFDIPDSEQPDGYAE